MTELVIPAEGTYSDIEHDFIENEPPGLFPGDQNSYYGQARKSFADQLQVLKDMMDQWYTNLDPRTVDLVDIRNWENELLIPVSAATKTLDQRRSFAISRLQRGPFTRTRRRLLVESFIFVTSGPPIIFVPAGVPFVGGGIPFGSEVTSVASSYRIYEDQRAFAYEVRVLNTVGEDSAGLLRELLRITPAGITVTLTHPANVLDYAKATKNDAPVAYWRLNTGDNTDASGYGLSLTPVGGSAAIASPGLLNAAVSGTNAARDLDGTTGYLSAGIGAAGGISNIKYTDQVSFEAWVRPDGLGGSGILKSIMYAPVCASLQVSGSDDANKFRFSVGGFIAKALASAVVGTTYHVVGTYDGKLVKLYVNGVLQQTTTAGYVDLDPTPHSIYIGYDGSVSTSFWNGGVDEPAVYDYALTAAQVLAKYNTGINVA